MATKKQWDKMQNEYQIFLKIMANQDSLYDLVDKYIEAKTGQIAALESLPVYFAETLEEIDERLHGIYGDKILKGID